jgi:hypothetical protein
VGYNLHITRAAFWADSSAVPITRAEWLSYLSEDSEIKSDTLNGPDDFLFAGHPNGPAPLWWSDGEIFTKNPDDEMIRKLCAIARSLDAKVLGDDGEEYCQ